MLTDGNIFCGFFLARMWNEKFPLNGNSRGRGTFFDSSLYRDEFSLTLRAVRSKWMSGFFLF